MATESLTFRGSITALITPFRDGKVDSKAFQSFVEWQIAQGSHGLVPCGTTGESATLSHAEHRHVVELCIEAAAGRVVSLPMHPDMPGGDIDRVVAAVTGFRG